MTVSDAVRNPASESHQLALSRWLVEDTLRTWNLGVCTVVWRDNAGRDSALYETQCEYLQVCFVTLKVLVNSQSNCRQVIVTLSGPGRCATMTMSNNKCSYETIRVHLVIHIF